MGCMRVADSQKHMEWDLHPQRALEQRSQAVLCTQTQSCPSLSFPSPFASNMNFVLCFPAQRGKVCRARCLLTDWTSAHESQEGVCMARGGAWTFMKATTTFIHGCLRQFWVCRLVCTISNMPFGTSQHPAALHLSVKLWKLLWLWAHCGVFSYSVALVHGERHVFLCTCQE